MKNEDLYHIYLETEPREYHNDNSECLRQWGNIEQVHHDPLTNS